MRQVLSAFLICWHILAMAQSPVLLTTDRSDSLLKAMPAIQLLDVRTPGEYANGHLHNAQNIDVRDASFTQQLAKLDPSKPVLVYCLAGSRSAKAAGILANAGFKEVYDMQGGFAKWTSANKPIDSAAEAPKGALTMDDFKRMTSSGKLVLVDFFAPWCAPCIKMLPTVKKLKTTMADQVTVVTIDYDQNRQLAQQLGVDEIPTLLLMKDGKTRWRGIGYMEENMLVKTIQENK
ncbi:thioredoxin domain-containing protein [Spirosoma sp. SC4-14]|uniref:thioredoxin domain-containing protein n=1 Tax=Spirosoma sp. SC4-14 TaxID=3128900 RepID=UPI0030D2F0EA